MSANGKDRVELMESLNITVKDSTGGDNLYLGRYGIFIPYSITNFMLFSEEFLVKDVLRRFREKQMNGDTDDSLAEDWLKAKDEHENDKRMEQLIDSYNKPTESLPLENPIILKKRNIRDILITKGLICSETE